MTKRILVGLALAIMSCSNSTNSEDEGTVDTCTPSTGVLELMSPESSQEWTVGDTKEIKWRYLPLEGFSSFNLDSRI